MLRWIWANRVPLVPVWVVLATAAAGLTARFVGTALPSWQIAGVTALACLPSAAYAWRIKAPWHRRWVLALTFYVGGAVTWMHGLTRAEDILPASVLLLGLGVAMLVGRMVNGGLGERVTTEGELRDWPEAAKRIAMPELRWVGTKIIPGQGWTAKLTWPRGAYDIDAVRKSVHRIEGARDLPTGSLRLLPVGRSHNTLDAIYLARDPSKGRVLDWPGPSKVDGYSAADPVPLGEHDDETVVSVQRFRPGKGERRILVGGASESGKSGVINNFVGEDACRDDVVGLGMDLKGGIELGPWSKVLLWMIHNVDGAIEMCNALEAGAVYRQDYMREVLKVRVWPLSPALPAVRVTVDEIRKLAGSSSGRSGKQQRMLLDQLIDVATQGRAVGFGLLAAGQLLTLEALGTSQIRSQFDIRIGLRMNEEESAKYVFPDDPGLRLHKIPAELPGTAHVKDGDKLDPQTHRGYYWSDELVAEVAELRAGGGAMLDQGTGDAMAAASPMFAEIWARVQGGDVPAERGESDGDDRGTAGGDGVSIETALQLLGAQSGTGEQLVEQYRAGTLDPDILGMACDLTGRPRPVVPAVFEHGDVAMTEVVARNRARTSTPGAVEPTPLRPRAVERLSDDAAKAKMRAMLAAAGPQGCRAIELYQAATRSSSWFNPIINSWIDDEGSVVRNGHGRYADARVLAAAIRTSGHDG